MNPADRDKNVRPGLSRVRFYDGMPARAEDWQAAHDYHLHLRWLHNRTLHSPGVVRGVLDEFLVRASGRGDELLISPGLAIDGHGRELYLPAPERLRVPSAQLKGGTTLYVTARYTEKLADYREDPANPSLSGHAAISEGVRLDLTETPADNVESMELARIQLSGKALEIRNPEAAVPQPDEVDRTHTQSAGVRQPFSLSTSAQLIKSGEVNVPLQGEPEIPLERIGVGSRRFYVADVHPIEQGSVSWEIRAVMMPGRHAPPSGGSEAPGEVHYFLSFRNRGKAATLARYAVYRLPE